jgi:hypothetical protein
MVVSSRCVMRRHSPHEPRRRIMLLAEVHGHKYRVGRGIGICSASSASVLTTVAKLDTHLEVVGRQRPNSDLVVSAKSASSSHLKFLIPGPLVRVQPGVVQKHLETGAFLTQGDGRFRRSRLCPQKASILYHYGAGIRGRDIVSAVKGCLSLPTGLKASGCRLGG